MGPTLSRGRGVALCRPACPALSRSSSRPALALPVFNHFLHLFCTGFTDLILSVFFDFPFDSLNQIIETSVFVFGLVILDPFVMLDAGFDVLVMPDSLLKEILLY